MTPVTILAIETSCDETAVAIVQKSGDDIFVLSNIVSSQIALHAPFGGVVPNLAAREHVKNIVPVVESALREAGVSRKNIEALAVTAGPGLMPALQIGVITAKTLSYLWKKPLLPIHHIEGHIYANFINVGIAQFTLFNAEEAKKKNFLKRNVSPLVKKILFLGRRTLQTRKSYNKQPTKNQTTTAKSTTESQEPEVNPFERKSGTPFPLLALVVSGGHTELVFMRDHFDYKILGETEDDAVGEAFDKVAKMLGLPYPGGPEIERRARDFRFPISTVKSNSKTKNSNISSELKIQNSKVAPFAFPRPMIESNDYRFSFSGLKTAVLYFLKKHENEKNDENFINAVCYEFQEATIDVLIKKTHRAIIEYQPKTVIIAGGVSANTELRKRMKHLVEKNFCDINFLMPPLEYSLDNAAMIGSSALFRWEHMSQEEKKRAFTTWQTLEANPNMKLSK